ncbi:uncharacterized protein CcaverHIS019_0210890 [Cutaneotrichosporon cavernicola]|uniref:Gfo/Idh/MocA-like oxidoreductase N-terminal domain-containing protein n=1 Tax=Cutaneotrichosporon cavernicola TaxID=279322 RepID=A0AA48I5K4_9TREE|nr:uncharacterized protein CcaverHIS019_0210890 [Cutaneotrichosporon cavernicola]BEI89727.1 hypothetical protein CcaverHIS019_0210890 [Cutaneotrichosporon cavernicola]BEI97498.1 hypothetical protein CcaverHIS631_0210870 [Cutaneotrichosporon cavernicola]BEJ05276.1 hypothetical protein CcaverHIS641_0210930 [Cutaneotrichosporon cavernicola]
MVTAALLGSGLFARNSYLPALPVPGLTVSTLWSRSEASVSTLAQAASERGLNPTVLSGDDGLDAILDNPDIDALILVLPIGVQSAIIRRAWTKGKHVISEKPVGRNVEEAKELVDEYERMWADKLVWRVAENFAHEPFLHRAASLLAESGPVLYWRMHYETILPQGASYHATTWRTVPDYQGGFLLDGGVHWAALARTVLPERCKPYSIIANKSLHRAYMLPHDTLIGIVQSDPASSLPPHGKRTQFEGTLKEEDMPVQSGESAPTGTFLLSWAIPDTNRSTRPANELYVVCDKATLRVINMGREWKIILEPEVGERVEEGGAVSGVKVELEDFADAVAARKEGRPEGKNYGAPRDALWDVAFIQAALDSDGEKVVIDDVLRG